METPERTGALAREAQKPWSARPVRERLAVIRRLRHGIADAARELAVAVSGERTAEVLTSEILPLADACRFLEREAETLLAPRRLGADGRPFWLRGVETEIRREPLGLVLVIAPANYPLFLPGVQAVQALAAGNAVLWKPGRGGSPAARAFAGLLAAAGLPERLLTILPEGDDAGREAIGSGTAGPDKVLLTGAAETGQAVLAQLAPRLTPATMELSGDDPVFLLPGCREAELDRAARALGFGLRLNGGATCIAPRRVFVPRPLRPGLAARLADLPGGPPAPTELEIVEVAGIEEALAAAAASPYALGAAVFGPEEEALALAGRLRAGVVVVNDLIVPTADPRLPFGGRGRSGYGSTRGAEGLLELTAVKAIAVRQGSWLPHLDPPREEDEALFRAYLALAHGGGLRARLAGLAGLLKAIVRRPSLPSLPLTPQKEMP